MEILAVTEVMLYILLFIIGALFGSFYNVCIYRMPREEKIGMTRSRCPHCKETIRWHDNIPFISYIILKAKCRNCGKKISFRYFLVEFLSGVILCVVWWQFTPVAALIYFIFISMLLIGSVIDLDFMIIPDSITLGGLAAGLVLCTLYPQLMGETIWWKGLYQSFFSAVISGGVLYLVAFFGSIIFRKEAMGMGDVKLLAMIGSFIGWQWGLFSIFAGSLIGTLASIILITLRKTDIKGQIPFGPFLSLGAVLSLFFGRTVVSWYLNLLM